MKKGELRGDIWVPGGPTDEQGKAMSCELMIVAEGAGKEENKQGRVLVGPTGKETDNLLRRVVGVQRGDVYATNVLKYLDAVDGGMGLMSALLRDEIREARPQVILALGAVAIQWFFPDLYESYDVETMNAMPHQWEDIQVVPSFHPAAEFHDSSKMAWIIEAFGVAGSLLKGSEVDYEERCPTRCRKLRTGDLGGVVGVDTESLSDDSPFMVTASSTEGYGGFLLCQKTSPYGNSRSQNCDALHDLSALARHLGRKDVLTVLHNALYDLPILWDLGIHPSKWVDTMGMAFMLQTLPLSLRSLAYRLLRSRLRDYDEVVGKAKDLSAIPLINAVKYACAHADATISVYNILLPMIQEWGMEEPLQRDMDIMPMIDDMMRNGMKLDREHIAGLEDEFTVRSLGIGAEINKIAGREINPGSDKQVSGLLYKEMKLGKGIRIPRTKWGGSRAAKVLEKIRHKHRIIPLLLDWTEMDTLIDKYLKVLPKKMEEDGRIHTKLSLVRVPHSGRLASSSPNMMAQPTRTEDGKRIRDGFVAEPGWKLVSFDYSQIEMRIMAHESQDPVMLDVYRTGKDIHAETAADTFGIRIEDIDEMKHRYPAKRTGFLVIYQGTAMGLSRELQAEGLSEWTEDRCEEFIRAWFDKYKGVRAYIDRLKTEIRRHGYVTDMWGRRLLIPEVKSIFPYMRESGLRRGGNMPIQGGAQGVIKEAMRRLWPLIEGWKKDGFGVKPLLQIHDDLLFEIRVDGIGNPSKHIVPSIKKTMEDTVKLSVPVVVDVKEGERWGSMSHLP